MYSEVAALVRILKPMEMFKLGLPDDLASSVPDAAKSQLIPGVYDNTANRTENVVVTGQALWIVREEIRYSDMADVTWWPEEKREANALLITLRDGTTKQVLVRGRKEHTADVFEFCRFVMRAIGRVQSAHINETGNDFADLKHRKKLSFPAS